MKVKLPIFWHTDESALFSELGIDKDENENEFQDCIERELIFYNITAIYKYLGLDIYTTIIAGGEKYICTLPIKEVEALIDGNKS
jgi:hypothetical protein